MFKKNLKKILVLFFLIYLFDLVILMITPNKALALENLFAYPIYVLKLSQSFLFRHDYPVKPKSVYTIALIGDSMTAALREAEFQLQNFLLPYYRQRKIKVLNYGFSSTNILSVKDRLLNETNYLKNTYPPLLKAKPDIIFIESMGNNPLSQFPVEEGLKKQTEALDEIINLIEKESPDSMIIFIATVGPSSKYAQGIINLKPEQRIEWKKEREEYIKNHTAYAKSHNIPLIDLYSKTQGLSESPYISQADYIHPSYDGLLYVNQAIAQFIIEKRLLPI